MVYRDIQSDTYLFAVADGHGIFGEKISTLVTTCVAVILKEHKVYVATVGDSRCVFFSAIDCKQLTINYKPSLEEEKILGHGGVICKIIEKNREEFGPLRVWSTNKLHSSLAMTRSIGDTHMQTIGIIMDVMTKEEVKKIAMGVYKEREDPYKGVVKLIDEAYARWMNKKADDITIVLVFINNLRATN